MSHCRRSVTALLPIFVLLFQHQTKATFALSLTARSNPTTTSAHSTFSSDNAIRNIMSEIPLDVLAAHANSYASANGIQVERRRDNGNSSSSYFECAPMSLLPNAYPKHAFQQAHDVAPAFNELVDRVSQDDKFLMSTLGGGVSTMDPYTGKLLQLYQQVYVDDQNPSSPAKMADRLGIHRSDYMLHRNNDDEPYQLKQVELNTIAASFAGLSCKVANLHQYLTSRFQHEVYEFLDANQKIVSTNSNDDGIKVGVPENPALQRIPMAMKIAFDRYAERFAVANKQNLVVLFVVQEGESNTVDQRLLEFALWEAHGIPVTRLSLTKLYSDLDVNEQGVMSLKSTNQEVALVYFRAGYAPTDYPDGEDGKEWQARLRLEQSRAAKCPSLGYHLAGTKKVQQELARSGVLERFFPEDKSKSKVEAMRACFAELYSMGDDATAEDLQASQDVLDGHEGRYVLKPQREGGGYNFYGKDLAEKLRANTTKDNSTGALLLGEALAEYILMQRLFPPSQRAVLLRGGKLEGSGDTISELGCYACLLVSPDGSVLHNEYAGFLLRTKFSNVDEGGVASGFATLSSPYLC